MANFAILETILGNQYGWTKGDAPGVLCPVCHGKTGVVDSRVLRCGNDAAIRRRRRCDSCNHRWTTYELTREQIEHAARGADFNRQMARELREIASELESDE